MADVGVEEGGETGSAGRLTRGRLEAFSDGVLAILITIMVLELPLPRSAGWSALDDKRVAGTFLIYALSFTFLGIYWSNHHHMLSMVERVTGGILWANLNLLFWLSLIPLVTRWMGAYGLRTPPTVVYGVVSLLAALAYYVLQTTIIRSQGLDSRLAAALGNDAKGKISPLAYVAAIALAFITPWVSIALFVAVAVMWIVPDRRIERRVA